MNRLLEAQEAGVTYRAGFAGRVRNKALRPLSLSVGGPSPGFTAIVGESGSGKTTLMRMLLGFQPATEGRVLFEGRPLATLRGAEAKRFRREVQAIFQDPFDVFNPFYRIEHPLVTPLRAFGLAASRDEAMAQVAQAMEAVGLRPKETLGKYPFQLSGGQRQRVMIARALALKPSIILADEPVSMVDASLRASILEALWRMNREAGIALVYVTHDLATAYQVADVILVLYGGQVMEIGPAAEMIHRPRHPYTQALIEAVPSPDPAAPWDLGDGTAVPEAGVPAQGCPFAPRCPVAMAACMTETPVLRRTGPHQAAACLRAGGEEPVTVRTVQEAVQQAMPAGHGAGGQAA